MVARNPYIKIQKQINDSYNKLQVEIDTVWSLDHKKIKALRAELQSLDAKAQSAIETLKYSKDTEDPENYDERIVFFHWICSGVKTLQKELDNKDTFKNWLGLS